GLLGEIEQDRPGLNQGQRLAVRTLRVDQGRDPAGRVDLQIIRLFLVALRQVQDMDLASDAAFVDRDRGALPVAGAVGVELHRFSPVMRGARAASYRARMRSNSLSARHTPLGGGEGWGEVTFRRTAGPKS